MALPRKQLNYLFFLLALPGLAACTGAVKTTIRQPVEQYDGVLLYLYRPDSMSNILISPRLSVDGAGAFPFKNDHYTYLQLPAGDHRVQLLLSERYQGHHEFEFSAETGQVHYLRIGTKMAFRKNDLYVRRFDLQPVSAEIAREEMASCRYFSLQAEDKADDPATGSVESQPRADDSSFSINKSRDPFSRNK